MIYIPVHSLVMPILLTIVLALLDIDFSGPYMTLLYYGVSFVLVLAIMFRYLKASFSDFIDEFWRALLAVVLGYLLYRILLVIAVFALSQAMEGVNPNQEAIAKEIEANFRVMIVVSALLAPIVEEAMFRGALFGTIRQKSRIVAYIVSTILFSLFHLWDFLLFDFSWETLLFLVQYIPAGLALAWCYDRSSTIWSPILLHAAINIIAMLQSGS